MIDTPGYMRDTCTFLKWYFSSKNSSYWDALGFLCRHTSSTWDKYPTSARPTNNLKPGSCPKSASTIYLQLNFLETPKIGYLLPTSVLGFFKNTNNSSQNIHPKEPNTKLHIKTDVLHSKRHHLFKKNVFLAKTPCYVNKASLFLFVYRICMGGIPLPLYLYFRCIITNSMVHGFAISYKS